MANEAQFQNAFGEEITAPGQQTFSQTLPQGWDAGINAAQAEFDKQREKPIEQEIFNAFQDDWANASGGYAAMVSAGVDPQEAAAMYIAPQTAKYAAFAPIARNLNNQRDDWRMTGGADTGLWAMNPRTGQREMVAPGRVSVDRVGLENLDSINRQIETLQKNIGDYRFDQTALSAKLTELQKLKASYGNSQATPEPFSNSMFPMPVSRNESGFIGTPGGQNAFQGGDPAEMVPRAITGPARPVSGSTQGDLKVGDVVKGYQYIGGPRNSKSSWQKVR